MFICKNSQDLEEAVSSELDFVAEVLLAAPLHKHPCLVAVSWQRCGCHTPIGEELDKDNSGEISLQEFRMRLREDMVCKKNGGGGMS